MTKLGVGSEVQIEQFSPPEFRVEGIAKTRQVLVIPGAVYTGGGSGTGDVDGPASAVGDNLAAYDGTTGKLLKDSGLATSAVATLASVQVLTNKDLTSGTNTFPTFNQNTTGSAAKWTTARTVSLTGDVTWSQSVDGSGNVSGAATLATVNSNTGSFGGAASVPAFSVNGKGLITSVTPTAISITASAVSDFSTAADARITAAGLLTTAAAPELIRDTIGTALVEGTGIDITVDDGGDTITIAATGGGGGGGTVDSIVAGTNIDVDSTDPANPVVSVESLVAADLTDVTATATELNYTDGVTSAIQTQLDAKASTSALTAHIDDTTDAHDASAISFVPDDLPISSTDVQSALYDAFIDPYAFAHNGTTAAPGVSVHLQSEIGRTTVTASGTTYTVQDSDHGKRLQFTNASNIAVAVPNTLRSDFVCDWEQFGTGVPTFTGSSCTVRARGGANKSAGQYAVGGLSRADSDEFLLYGDITT